VQRENDVFIGAAPYVDASDVLYAFANVTYYSGIRQSSLLIKRPATEIDGARPTLVRSQLIDAMDTSTDWNWVPAYTDPNQGETAFFEPWQAADGERGFTLDAKMFPHERPMSFYFGTRKIGDPQFRGSGDAALSIDYLEASKPEKLTVRVKHRRPGEYGQEYTHDALPTVDDASTSTAGGNSHWQTLRIGREQLHDAQGNTLPDWEHVDYFILQGASAAGKPPVFKRLRW
jgi:hypothetical protein